MIKEKAPTQNYIENVLIHTHLATPHICMIHTGGGGGSLGIALAVLTIVSSWGLKLIELIELNRLYSYETEKKSYFEGHEIFEHNKPKVFIQS